MSKADDAYREAERRISEDPDATGLDLSIENLETIPPELANLTNLRSLHLRNTQISSAEPIAKLTNLTLLDLRKTQISSAEPIAKLTNLTVLDLRNTHISSAEPIAKLSNLIELFLSGTKITDLRPIKNLENLIGKSKFHSLEFRNCTATRLDPKLKALSEIENNKERTRDTLAYLKSLTEWPPAKAMPKDQPGPPQYRVPDHGPVTQSDTPLGSITAEQDALQQDCREKIRTLLGTIRENDNQLAPLINAAEKYRTLINKPAQDILASALWSAANTLRAQHEVHQAATKQGRQNEELPPTTATALLDLLQTHGLFYMGHPGAAEIERKMREFLEGPRNPKARELASEITETLIENPKVLDPASAEPLAQDSAAASGQGPSAQMAEVSEQGRLRNIINAIGRKIWEISKSKAGVAIDTAIKIEVALWLTTNKSLIAKFYETITTQYPHWLDAIVKLIP